MTKKDLIKKIMELNKSGDIKQSTFENQHIQILQDIYNARKMFLKMQIEDFNEWLKHQDFYNGGLSLQLIAYILGITRERVRQLELSAIKKLKHPKIGKKLKDLIEE